MNFLIYSLQICALFCRCVVRCMWRWEEQTLFRVSLVFPHFYVFFCSRLLFLTIATTIQSVWCVFFVCYSDKISFFASSSIVIYCCCVVQMEKWNKIYMKIGTKREQFFARYILKCWPISPSLEYNNFSVCVVSFRCTHLYANTVTNVWRFVTLWVCVCASQSSFSVLFFCRFVLRCCRLYAFLTCAKAIYYAFFSCIFACTNSQRQRD